MNLVGSWFRCLRDVVWEALRASGPGHAVRRLDTQESIAWPLSIRGFVSTRHSAAEWAGTVVPMMV
jgi:hypothetical protein